MKILFNTNMSYNDGTYLTQLVYQIYFEASSIDYYMTLSQKGLRSNIKIFDITVIPELHKGGL